MALTKVGKEGVTGISNSSNATAITIDSSENVGIGKSPVSAMLDVSGNVKAGNGTASAPSYSFQGSSAIGMFTPDSGFSVAFGTGGSERCRVDSSGNLLVGQSSTTVPGAGNTTAGTSIRGTDGVFISRTTSDTGASALQVNKTTGAGAIINIASGGTTVGSIGFVSTGSYIQGETDHSGFRFGANQIVPFRNGADTDNTTDLGASGARFDDIFATNGTINTSDQNEKQQIASLTDAEITAAKAISASFKTFKWNDKVEAKGDAARTHTGVIAQEVQTAMTNAGLDATDYAFWCSDTWWETSTDVPAVDAVDEVTDENGSVTTEAVEAKDAYTRIDTYSTADEAPDGATQRTRMGIRYPELLAFVSAATEQRLSNIETRLTALEAE